LPERSARRDRVRQRAPCDLVLVDRRDVDDHDRPFRGSECNGRRVSSSCADGLRPPTIRHQPIQAGARKTRPPSTDVPGLATLHRSGEAARLPLDDTGNDARPTTS
jgi:hypothetical protein